MSSNPFFSSLPSRGQELFLQSFLGLYCNADDQLVGNHQRPVVSGSVHRAASSLAATIWHHHKQSPLYSANLCPILLALLCAFEKTNPACHWQTAITTKFMRCLFNVKEAGAPASPFFYIAPATTTNLAIGNSFFATRCCEYSEAKQPSKTKIINLARVLYQDTAKSVIKQDNRRLEHLAKYGAIPFVRQRCREKMDSPVLRFISVVQHFQWLIPDCTSKTTME
jgi:hypothetical protein